MPTLTLLFSRRCVLGGILGASVFFMFFIFIFTKKNFKFQFRKVAIAASIPRQILT